MYATVVQGGAEPAKRGDMDRVVRDVLVPALQEAPGFRGTLNLVDRQTGHGMMIMLWQTEAQASDPTALTAEVQSAVAQVIALSSGERAPMRILEVNAFVAAPSEAPSR